jgi:predicted DNA-binding transcriptional regulator AlpA
MRTIKQYVTRNDVRARYGNKSAMTIWRWENDENLGFPKAITINGRRYYDLEELEAWERARSISTPDRGKDVP